MIELSDGLLLSLSQAFAERFAGSFIRVFDGVAPISAADAESGTLLGIVSIDASGTGLQFIASSAFVYTPPSQRWAFTGLADGTATYFRLVAPGDGGELSATDLRVQGAIGVFGDGTDMEWSTATVLGGATYTIDSFIYIVHPIARTAP